MRQEAIPQIAITVSKTSDGESDYIQITSSDMMTLNVVLVATSVTIDDRRPTKKKPKGRK